jgi:hypothetical protein
MDNKTFSITDITEWNLVLCEFIKFIKILVMDNHNIRKWFKYVTTYLSLNFQLCILQYVANVSIKMRYDNIFSSSSSCNHRDMKIMNNNSAFSHHYHYLTVTGFNCI